MTFAAKHPSHKSVLEVQYREQLQGWVCNMEHWTVCKSHKSYTG